MIRVRSESIGIARVIMAIIIVSAIGMLPICCSGRASAPSVLFVTIDTLRADHLGCYGYPRETSPAIDAFAAESVLFENCISQATSTVPSHASMFTSLYPPTHGVTHNLASLPPEVPSLVRVFRDNGYATGAVVSSVIVDSRSGLNQGFQSYDATLEASELNRAKFLERHANSTTNAAIKWLEDRNKQRFFLWVHYIDPHGAYHPPPEYRHMFLDDELYSGDEEMPIGSGNAVRRMIPQYQALFGNKNPSYYVAQYDGEIRFADDNLGRLIEYLRQSGRISKTIVVITADHGETLTERDFCFAHTFRTYDEQAHIPLMIHFPDSNLRKRIKAQVRGIDIMPTILDALDLQSPHFVQGHSLMQLITSGEAPPEDFAVTYSDYGIEAVDTQYGTQKSIRTENWKFTENSDGSIELYNLKEYPGEKDNLSLEEPTIVKELAGRFEIWEKGLDRTNTFMRMPSPKRVEELKSLGYLGD